MKSVLTYILSAALFFLCLGITVFAFTDAGKEGYNAILEKTFVKNTPYTFEEVKETVKKNRDKYTPVVTLSQTSRSRINEME